MNREDLKDIIQRIAEKIEKQTPETGCIFGDCDDYTCPDTCDMTTRYAVGEES